MEILHLDLHYIMSKIDYVSEEKIRRLNTDQLIRGANMSAHLTGYLTEGGVLSFTITNRDFSCRVTCKNPCDGISILGQLRRSHESCSKLVVFALRRSTIF